MYERAEWALDRLQHAISQRDLERLLGLSAGYLSKLKSGKRTSGPLAAVLLLLAFDPDRLGELKRLLRMEWLPGVRPRVVTVEAMEGMVPPTTSRDLSLDQIPSTRSRAPSPSEDPSIGVEEIAA